MKGGPLIQDGHTLRSDSLELELTPGVVSLDVVHQIPLLTIGGVTVNAIELFESIMDLFVSSESVSPGEKLATDVAGEVPQAIVNGVDVIME